MSGSGVQIVNVLFPAARNRKIRASFTGTVASPYGIIVDVSGTNAAGSAIYEQLLFNSGAANPTAISTQTFKTITYIHIYAGSVSQPFNPADIGKPLLVAVDNAFPQEFSGDALTSLLNATGWPTGDRDIQNGKSLIQAYTATGEGVLMLRAGFSLSVVMASVFFAIAIID